MLQRFSPGEGNDEENVGLTYQTKELPCWHHDFSSHASLSQSTTRKWLQVFTFLIDAVFVWDEAFLDDAHSLVLEYGRMIDVSNR